MKLQSFLIAFPVLTLLTGCATRAVPPAPAAASSTTQERLAAAVRYLVACQSPDGAWRSDTYGTFKDGTGLTPLVLNALDSLPVDLRPASACERGAAYLAAMVGPNGEIFPPPYGFDFPLYTAALSVTILSNPLHASHRAARDAWLKYLRERQLTEALGWKRANPEYGGWGYCRTIPRRPEPGAFAPPLIESNLSATRYALEALRSAVVSPKDPAFARALVFVERCQNLPADLACADPEYDDGGFHFIYDDPVRNKAGIAGQDRAGRTRFASYGSTTADGLRALLACGLPQTDRRVGAALGWLKTNFATDRHPGRYVERHESNRQGVYFYYAAAVAGALRTVGMGAQKERDGFADWQRDLAKELIGRQQPDGSWSNPAHAMREDDPVVATALALTALTQCSNGSVNP